MANINRAAGALRWGLEEKRLVSQYIQDGRLDPTRVGSAAYLATLKPLEPLWARHIPKNFYQNIRRNVASYMAEQDGIGQRRNDQNARPNARPRQQAPQQQDAAAAVDDDMEVDEDEFNDAVEDDNEIPAPPAAGEFVCLLA